jgi:hypothetical protein
MKAFQANDNSNQRHRIAAYLLRGLGYSSVIDFQQDHHLIADGWIGINTYNAMYNKILNVEDIQYKGSYFESNFKNKSQIVWHHSAGWDNARGMFDYFATTGGVATSIGIEDSGKIYRAFDEDKWAYHIGLGNAVLEQISIGVEVCNWGYLTYDRGQYKSYTGTVIEPKKVTAVSYKGYDFWESYTKQEIESLKYWTLLNAMRYDIPLIHSDSDMWGVSQKALAGHAGLYTHNSYISWKADVYPHPLLTSMYKEITSI